MCGIYLPDILAWLKQPKEKENLRKIVQLALCALSCFVIMEGAKQLGRLDYADPKWLSYRIFNSARAALLDREEFEYGQDPQFYKSIGYDEVDVKMMNVLWNFDDPEVFTVDRFNAILDKIEVTEVDRVSSLKRFVNDSIRFFIKSDGLVFTCFFLLSLFLFIGKKQDKAVGASVLLCVAAAAFGISYTYFYRKSVYLGRVHLSAFLAMIIAILYRATSAR